MQDHEVNAMTNEQAQRVELLARIDELDRLAEITTDRDTLERIAERKKELRQVLANL